MSVHYLSACWKLEGLTSTQKFVLISLADQANDSGVCWPSMSSIAKRTCLSDKAVRQAIKQLEAIGMLRIERKKHDTRDQWVSNRYMLTPENYKQVPTDGEYLPTVSTNPELVGYLPTVSRVPTDVPINRNRTVNESSNKRHLSSGDDEAEMSEGKPKAESVPYVEIFELYELHCCKHPFNRPRVLIRDDKRKQLIKKVWGLSNRTKTLEFWDEYFKLATENAHWMYGDKHKGGTWPGANFDFLLKADRVKAIVEGNV